MRGGLKALLGLWALLALGCSTATEQPGPTAKTQEPLVNDGVQKVPAPDRVNHETFGASVAISTNFAVVGAPNADSGQGAAFLYERSGAAWVFRQKLRAPDGGNFGTTVAVNGNTVVVGAPRVAVPTPWNSGAVYVYTHDGSAATLIQKFASQSNVGFPIRTRFYGNWIALEGNVLVIDDLVLAHVFERVDGLFVETETLAQSPDSEHVRSIALSGNTLIRGIGQNALGIGGAAADIYVRTGSPAGFQHQQRIVPMDPGLQTFGSSVALSGDTALVAAGSGFNHAGSAYIYTRSGSSWTNQATLVESPSPSTTFASSVGLVGDVAVIGAPGRDHGEGEEGSAYVFTRSESGWAQTRELKAFDGHKGDGLGSAVAVSPNFALVGAPYDDIPALVQGSVYFFALESVPPREICVSTCSGDTDCPPGNYCESNGLCLPQKARGRACEAADCRAPGCSVCETGFCVDGFCCESACSTDGVACASLLTGRANGICSTELGGSCGSGGSGPSGGAGGGGGSSGAAGTSSGGGANGGAGGSNSGGAAGSAGSGAGTGGGAGSGGSEGPCVRVAPDGDDASAAASEGATPFRNVQPAIDFADTHRHIASRVCIASGPTCSGSTQFTFSGPDGADLRMRNGIGVFGRYESSTWTRCTDSITRIMPTTERGIVFGSDITASTELNGIETFGPFTEPSAAVTIDGARGAKLADMHVIAGSLTIEVTYGIRIEPGSDVTVERSRIAVSGRSWSVALSLADADLLLVDSFAQSFSTIGSGAVLELEDPRDVRVISSTITRFDGGGAVVAVGDVGALLVEDSTVNAFANQLAATGIEIAATGATGVTLRRNVVRVEGQYDLTGVAIVGGGAVVDSNQIECSGTGFGITLGLLCDGLDEAASCREVTRNIVTSPSCSGCVYESTGMVIAGMDTLVDSNHVEGGCSSGATWSTAVGLRISGAARIQNNVFNGSTCVGAGQGVFGNGVIVDSDAGTVDLSSNFIDGGRATASGCQTSGVRLLGGDVMLRNNIVAPGLCPIAFNLDQQLGAIMPTALENNDFAPGSATAQLYRIIGVTDPTTIAEVNALPGAGGNFTAVCEYPLEAGSACIDAGTPEGAPEHDIDGDARDDGAPDVGPDEFVAGTG